MRAGASSKRASREWSPVRSIRPATAARRELRESGVEVVVAGRSRGARPHRNVRALERELQRPYVAREDGDVARRRVSRASPACERGWVLKRNGATCASCAIALRCGDGRRGNGSRRRSAAHGASAAPSRAAVRSRRRVRNRRVAARRAAYSHLKKVTPKRSCWRPLRLRQRFEELADVADVLCVGERRRRTTLDLSAAMQALREARHLQHTCAKAARRWRRS